MAIDQHSLCESTVWNPPLARLGGVLAQRAAAVALPVEIGGVSRVLGG
jgi:hypothetical protein